MQSLLSPYSGLPPRQFWRTGVSDDHVLSCNTLWRKKFDLTPEDKIASAGSCFAQHISRRLAQAGYSYLDFEPAPDALPEAMHQRFGYGIYSARYANIYTSRQLLELAQEATGSLPSLDYSWEKNGRFYDPLRPSVEPEGLASHEEVLHHRRHHLTQVRKLLTACDVFVFTLGLTETWMCTRSGRSLPVAPGTIAGDYKPELYRFHNLTYPEVEADLRAFMAIMDNLRPGKPRRYLFTVSPVPLTATAADQHVLAATTYSKSVLRAVAGALCDSMKTVDYFPSYEIISAPWSRGHFYAANLRSVVPAGVDAAMRAFFLEHNPKAADPLAPSDTELAAKVDRGEVSAPSEEDDDVACEEALLEGFSR